MTVAVVYCEKAHSAGCETHRHGRANVSHAYDAGRLAEERQAQRFADQTVSQCPLRLGHAAREQGNIGGNIGDVVS